MGILGEKLHRSRGSGKLDHVLVTECGSRRGLDRYQEFSRSHRPYSRAVLTMVLLQHGRGSWRDGEGDEAQGQDAWRGQAFPLRAPGSPCLPEREVAGGP